MKPFLGIHAAMYCIWLSLPGCGARDADKPPASRPIISAGSSKAALLATIPDDAEPPPVSLYSGLGPHSGRSPGQMEFIFSERGGGVAFVVEKDRKVQVIHNGRPGKLYASVGSVALSADGRRCAYGALVDGKWRMVVDGVEGEGFSAVKSPVFSADGSHVAYQAMAGELWHLVVDTTVDRGTRTRYLKHEFSADASRISFIVDVDDRGMGKLVVSDLAFEHQTTVATGVLSMLLDTDRTRIAAIGTSDDQQRVLAFSLTRPDRVKMGPKFDSVHGLVLGSDGASVAYLADRSGNRVVVLDGKEEPLSPGDDVVGLPAIRPGNGALGALVASGGSVLLREFFVGGGHGEPAYEEAEGLLYSEDGRFHAYAARKRESWFVVVNGREGPAFDRVVTPLFSPDGKFLVYRARKDGKRFVVVADTSGKTIRQLPAYEQVFPVRFTGDGKSITYGVKDGRKLACVTEAL